MERRIKTLLEKYDKSLENSDDSSYILIIKLKILDDLYYNKDELSIDFMIESLSKLGYSASILYDDNGNFAVADIKIQNLIFEKDFDKQTDFHGTWEIPPYGWHPTIRESFNFYINNLMNQ